MGEIAGGKCFRLLLSASGIQGTKLGAVVGSIVLPFGLVLPQYSVTHNLDPGNRQTPPY